MDFHEIKSRAGMLLFSQKAGVLRRWANVGAAGHGLRISSHLEIAQGESGRKLRAGTALGRLGRRKKGLCGAPWGWSCLRVRRIRQV